MNVAIALAPDPDFVPAAWPIDTIEISRSGITENRYFSLDELRVASLRGHREGARTPTGMGVNAAVKPGLSADQSAATRQKVIADIEKESREKTGLRSDVVTLYQGGEYHLYRFKRYDDVRLVFAPEQQIAFYGGDPDNFEYPRYDLDVCVFRAYENGQPAKIEHFLKWNSGTKRW